MNKIIVKCHNKRCIYNSGFSDGRCELDKEVQLSNRGICTSEKKKQLGRGEYGNGLYIDEER